MAALKILNNSIKATKPPDPSPYVPKVDKIRISVKIPQGDYGQIANAVYATENHPQFTPKKATSKWEVVKLISFFGSSEDVHFQFDPTKSYLPDALFEFNAGKLGPSGMQMLHEVLSPIFPGGWGYIVEHGQVSMIEIAVDLHGIRMHHFHLLPPQVRMSKTYADGGKLKGITTGNPKGNSLKLYSKSYETWVKLLKKKGAKGPPVVRIEQRLTRIKALKLNKLAQLGNPFAKVKLITLPPEAPGNAPKHWKAAWPMFTDSIAVRGLGPALKLLPPNVGTIFRKHFAAHEVSWWDPQAIWKHWPDVLAQSKLVPAPKWG